MQHNTSMANLAQYLADWRRGARLVLALVSLVVLALPLALPAAAAGPPVFPELISLPDGFRPEGITTGRGSTFFAGSLADGRIYKGDYRTGEGEVLVPGVGRPAVGLAYDSRSNYLFVAGGPSGKASVYDADTGQEVQVYDLPVGTSTFVNDVVVTRDAAYFTDSFAAQYYVLPLSARGALPDASQVEAIALGGDFEQVPGFNANGIEATANGERLFIVNSTAGLLFLVDPATGVAQQIDLGNGMEPPLPNGDGILLAGKTLYVVQNQLNQIAVVELSPDFSSGEVAPVITNDNFDIPTTVAGFGTRLYAVNARFGTPPTPTTTYEVVQVSKN